jgi:hypothetical protein
MGLAQCSQHAIRKGYRLLSASDTRLHDRELVAPEAPHEIGPAHRCMQTRANTLKEGITRGVTKIIIYVFEVIEIDPMHGEAIARP